MLIKTLRRLNLQMFCYSITSSSVPTLFAIYLQKHNMTALSLFFFSCRMALLFQTKIINRIKIIITILINVLKDTTYRYLK